MSLGWPHLLGRPVVRTSQFLFAATILVSKTKRFGSSASIRALTQCVLRAPKLAVLETAEERLRTAQAGTVGADVERARRHLQHLAVIGHRRRVVLDVLGADERLRGARCQRRLRRRGDCRGRKNIILCVLSDLCGCF